MDGQERGNQSNNKTFHMKVGRMEGSFKSRVKVRDDDNTFATWREDKDSLKSGIESQLNYSAGRNSRGEVEEDSEC